MKKHLLICIIGLCMFAIPAYADGNEVLTPTKCSIENKLVYEPINEVYITFASHIGIAKDAKADEAKAAGADIVLIPIRKKALQPSLSTRLFFQRANPISWKYPRELSIWRLRPL